MRKQSVVFKDNRDNRDNFYVHCASQVPCLQSSSVGVVACKHAL